MSDIFVESLENSEMDPFETKNSELENHHVTSQCMLFTRIQMVRDSEKLTLHYHLYTGVGSTVTCYYVC